MTVPCSRRLKQVGSTVSRWLQQRMATLSVDITIIKVAAVFLTVKRRWAISLLRHHRRQLYRHPRRQLWRKKGSGMVRSGLSDARIKRSCSREPNHKIPPISIAISRFESRKMALSEKRTLFELHLHEK